MKKAPETPGRVRPDPQAARRRRQAEALRANLRRRKQGAAAGEDGTGTESAPGPALERGPSLE